MVGSKPLIFLLLWLLSLAIMLVGLSGQPVDRTQEARVLVTAREMTDKPVQQWLLPTLNGQPRFQKPPLAPWLSAAAFKVIGVTEFAGRLPAVLCGWLTLAIVFCWARSVAGDRAGVMAAAGLLGSYLFFRMTRLAETDAIAMPWVTLAFFAIWQATRHDDPSTPIQSRFSATTYFHLAAAACGLAVMAKGAPALFPLIFLISLCIARRTARPLSVFLRSGALLTFAVIALPWFAYIWLDPESRRVMAHETSILVSGGGHEGWFFQYFLWIGMSALPWTGFVVIALVRAAAAFRRDGVSRELSVAGWSVLLPLLVAGQKQPHYLMSFMPILMVLTAVEIERLMRESAAARKLLMRVMAATLVAGAAAGVALLVVATTGGMRVPWLGYLVAIMLLLTMTITAVIAARRGLVVALASLGVAAPILFVAGFSYLWPAQSNGLNHRDLAILIRSKTAAGPIAWWGENDSLCLTFYLKQVMPSFDEDPATPDQLPPAGTNLIDFEPIARKIETPTGFVTALTIDVHDERLFVFIPSTPARPRID